MIYEKDYILRLIQLMGEFLRKLKEAASDVLFDAGLDLFLRENAGISLPAADALDAPSIIGMTTLRGRLAVFLGLVSRAERGGIDAQDWQVKALRLLISLREEDEVCRALEDEIYTLLKETADVLDTPCMLAAAEMLRSAGRYDRMDSAAFFLWEGLPDKDRDAWRGAIRDLYAPLDLLTDEALVRGGLSRDEKDESLRALCAGEARES